MVMTLRARWREQELNWCYQINLLNRATWAQQYFGLVSRLGDWPAWLLLGVWIMVWGGPLRFWILLHLLALGVFSLALYGALKNTSKRPRPLRMRKDLTTTIAPLDEFSFPSGHTLQAVSLSTVALHYFPALTAVLLVFTLSVAASRVILGLHYPSDVLAAAGIGFLLARVSIGLV